MSGFDPGYFHQLAALEEGHYWFENRNKLIVWALRRRFPAMRRFLEIGCGTGFVLRSISCAFPETAVSGSEFFEDGLSFARTRLPKAELFQLDARRLAADARYDVIGAFDVIEHIEEDEEVLTRMAGALKPGGGIVLTVPQHPELWSAFDDFSHHVRRYRRSGLEEKLGRAGFAVLDAVSFIVLPLPLVALTRRKKAGPGYDGMAELKTAAPVNAALHGVLGVERGLIRCGLRSPAGGSLLVSAVKK